MFLAVESITSVTAACADAILAAVFEQKERVNRETSAVDTIFVDANEEMRNRVIGARAVTRENSDEIVQQKVNDTSICRSSKHKRKLIVQGYNEETKKATKGRKIAHMDGNAQVEGAHSFGSL